MTLCTCVKILDVFSYWLVCPSDYFVGGTGIENLLGMRFSWHIHLAEEPGVDPKHVKEIVYLTSSGKAWREPWSSKLLLGRGMPGCPHRWNSTLKKWWEKKNYSIFHLSRIRSPKHLRKCVQIILSWNLQYSRFCVVVRVKCNKIEIFIVSFFLNKMSRPTQNISIVTDVYLRMKHQS